MSLAWFKQIRTAFPPESSRSRVGDKCHQLRYAINKLNYGTYHTFCPGFNLSFDEGGIAMRSRFCLIQQFNKDKPAKFCVEFFILADVPKYFVYHIDVYQEKIDANVRIPRELWNLQTKQKLVMNSVIQSGIANDPEAYQRVFMDNRYSVPELLVLL